MLLSSGTEIGTWLWGMPEEAFRLARSYGAGAMRIVQAGREKRDLLEVEWGSTT